MHRSNSYPISRILSSATLFLAAGLTATTAQAAAGHAHDAHSVNAGPDGHAPIGVMGDHTHAAGEWMLSYRYMYMEMDGNRDGEDRLSTEDVLAQFPVTPVRMTMQMHRFGLMRAPTDRLTLMAMLPYITKKMDHRTRMGGEFVTQTQGTGDFKFSLLYSLLQRPNHALHLNAGLSLPTGGIDKRDETPMGKVRLPYPMQLGSGTQDFMLGLTYRGKTGRLSWGAQASGWTRTGENSNDYTLGDSARATLWSAWQLNGQFSTSLRLEGNYWSDIDGADPQLNPNMIPTADPSLRGGQRLDLGLGVNWLHGSGHRLALELSAPVQQHLDGPQLETDLVLTAGWQRAW